ncbi:heterokaryon incompatibility [Fusarium longipes]|uniref:Heterokaryon incompatibility n=1 Tax=Fusarium longipes TaxID=694270 RepID=A0A395T6Q5_9HYPO|nr:heterokaryon incompatibility [Fusarium longipes]
MLELPKTFQEAVEITKALDIRYLWIDSFCIIQDDDNDWKTQASLMAAIYENAFITLAAGASQDDDVGQYTARNLTKSSDKLTALAGLAKKFQRVINSPYVAGLWLKTLRDDLAWCTQGDEAPLGRVRKGPSWTWVAASDIRIEWPQIELHPSFQVDGASLGEGSQRFDLQSCAESFSLRISGFIQSVSIRTHAELDSYPRALPLARNCEVVEWRRRHSEHSQLLVRCQASLVESIPSEPRLSTRDSDAELEKPTMYGHFTADYRFWESEEELRDKLQHVYFLLVGTKSDSGTLSLYGMMLKPRQDRWDESKDCYERIGWLRYCTLEHMQVSDWAAWRTPSTLNLS